MSVNDTPDSDNPQVPTSDAEVVPFDRVAAIRERLAASEGQKAGSPGMVSAEEGIPPEQTFEVVLRGVDGVTPSATLSFKGYMVATSVFVGFADGEGIINAMVPMDRVLYVKSSNQ